ncbi:hypothetical protein JOQ06_005701, partial [Pogonophryne albipinna]
MIGCRQTGRLASHVTVGHPCSQKQVVSDLSGFLMISTNSKGEAEAIETELLRDYKFGQQQLIEIWGQACALAITK